MKIDTDKLKKIVDEIDNIFVKNRLNVPEGQIILSKLIMNSTIHTLETLSDISNKEKIAMGMEAFKAINNGWIKTLKDFYKE